MDLAERLAHMPAFSSLDEASRGRLAAVASEERFVPGARILARGDAGDAMFAILAGAVEVPIRGDDGKLQLTKHLGRDDIFGEMALLTGAPRGADVVAAGDEECVCVRIPREEALALLAAHPSVARFLTDIVGKRLLESGQVRSVGKYRIVGEIGQGGVARVFEGLHPSLGRSVAIKMLSHELVWEADFKDRFLAEARMVAQLRHDNIVQVYDTERAYATFFIVMERLQGRELSVELKEGGPLDFESARAVVQQVARGLQYAHSHGVVHRDVKPANVFLESSGRVKVMDFGIATGVHDSPGGGGVMGTPGYIAPEVLSGQPADRRSDVYALGVTAWEMLTARHPFASEQRRDILTKQLKTERLDVARERDEVPPALVDLVARATERDPERRFQSCGEILEHLDASLAVRPADVEVLRATVQVPVGRGDEVRERLLGLAGDGVTVEVKE